MKVSTLSTILAVASTVSAGCYSGGVVWGNEAQTAIDAIRRFCNEGSLSGNFGGGQTKGKCQLLGNTKIGFFEVQNLSGVGNNMPAATCRTRLENEVKGCQHGGESVIDGWKFK